MTIGERVQSFVCPGFELPLRKSLPELDLKRLKAAFQSRIGIVHFLLMLRRTR